jgi:hypothetical protein
MDHAEIMEVRALCSKHGIDLQGTDGQPHHCGQRMHVKGGLLGPDWAKCEICGLTIANLASPHIAGRLYSEKDLASMGNATWGVISQGAMYPPEQNLP